MLLKGGHRSCWERAGLIGHCTGLCPFGLPILYCLHGIVDERSVQLRGICSRVSVVVKALWFTVAMLGRWSKHTVGVDSGYF